MNNDQFEKYSDIPASLFEQIDPSARITDKKLSTKPVGYFRDALRRFRRTLAQMG